MMKHFILKWQTPIALSFIIFISFGLMIPWLGYSFDEWHFIYYSTRGAEGIKELFHYDGHPQAVWSYLLSFRLLGYTPTYWHFYSLFWRIAATIAFWLCLENIWKNNQQQNFFTASLLALHPIFTLQAFPISYFEVWVGFFFIFLSFLFTVKATKDSSKQAYYLPLALLFQLGFVLSREYAWFVELTRPVLIWFTIGLKEVSIKNIFDTIKKWLPNLFIFLSALIWRGFFYTPLRKHFQVQSSIFTNPFKTLSTWLIDIIPDISMILVTSWYSVFNETYFDFRRAFNIGAFLLFIFLTISITLFLHKKSNNSKGKAKQIFFAGLPSLIFGILPFYIASYALHLTEPPHNSRIAFGMIPGAALVLSATIEYIISKPRAKAILMATLISLAAIWHIRYTNDFRKIWRYQSRLLEQITWRVPGIKEETTIYIYETKRPQIAPDSPARLALAGDFPTAMAINAIYQNNPEQQGSQLDYWTFYSLKTLETLPEHVPLEAGHATTSFKGNTENKLVFLFSPNKGQCLHLIQSGDEQYKRYPDPIKNVAPYLSANAINPDIGLQQSLRDQIFGKQKDEWCYYYENADLAQQHQNWAEIITLWDTATLKELQPSHGTEYIPFIEAYAYQGKWQEALQLTRNAKQLSKAMDSILCPLWEQIYQATTLTEKQAEAITQAQNLLECSPAITP